MNISEAKEALYFNGEKIRHRLFTPDEYLIVVDGVLKNERNTVLLEKEYWEIRNTPAFADGWEIINYTCDGCKVIQPFEHRCHGAGCNCDNPVCMEKQGRITEEELKSMVSDFLNKKHNKGKGYGIVTVLDENGTKQEFEINDFIRAKFIDNRLISVISYFGTNNDETFTISVENPISSGRNPMAMISLSKESFIGLIAASVIYFSCKGEDMSVLFHKAVTKNEIDFTFSDNLKSANEFLKPEKQTTKKRPDKQQKVYFIGIHNKPGMLPLDSKTKTGEIIDKIITELGDEFVCIKTNLFDTDNMVTDKKEILKQNLNWNEKYDLMPEDIVVLLGNDVKNNFMAKHDNTVFLSHPGWVVKKGHESKICYIQDSVILIKNKQKK